MRYILIGLLSLSYNCFSQTTPNLQLPSVIGPSPSVAAIQKYGDYKVSTYTGQPDITIPIYTIKLDDIAVPISISYHGGGINVNEEASRIGLGWSLQAGGTISRNVLGLDDFWSYSLNPTSFDLLGFPELSVVSATSLRFGGYTYDISSKLGLTVDPAFPFVSLDLEPDIFYYNFLGNNGKFLLQKKDTSAILEDPSSNMRIKLSITPYPANDTTGASKVGMNCTITATTGEGTIYSFTRFETCESQAGPGGGTAPMRNHITAWYLTRIQTVKGTVVNFNYTESGTGYTYALNQPSVRKYILPNYPATHHDTNPVGSAIPRNNYRNLLLSSITSTNCNVYFTYNDRLDIQGDKKLTSISVKDTKGSLVKKVNLIQDYFTANASLTNTFDLGGALWYNTTGLADSNWIKKRLKLTELKEFSSDTLLSLSHQFFYNENLLPVKNSTSRDHWGYFNNAPNGNNLLPDIYWAFPGMLRVSTPGDYRCNPNPGDPNDFGNTNILYQETSHKVYMYNQGANREIDTAYSKAFLLNKIVYPTGGYTQFAFEQNTYDKKKSFVNDPNASNYDYALGSKSLAFVSGISGIPSGYSQTFNFSITAYDTLPGEGVAIVSLQLKALKGGNNTSTSLVNTVFVLKNSSGTILDQTSFNSYSTLTNNGDNTYSPPLLGGRLPIGTYTIQLTYGANVVDKNSVYYSVTGSWASVKDQNTDSIMYKYAGGLRIKNIASYTSSGNLASSIDYIYHYSADNNHNGIPEFYSTGKIMERPNYFEASWGSTTIETSMRSDITANVNIGYDSVITEQNKIRHLDVFNNSSYRPQLYKTHYTSPGNEMMPVGLANIPQLNVGGIGNLWPDLFFDCTPVATKSFFDNANGKLTKAIDYLYDSITGNYKVVKQIENTYSGTGTGTNGIVWADRIYVSNNEMLYNCLRGLPPIYGVTNFFYPAFRSVAVQPLQSTEKLYTPVDSITTITNYVYNLNKLLSRKSSINSKRDTLVNTYTYPLDYTVSNGSWLKKMQVANMVAIPIDERSLKNSLTTGGVFTQFDTGNNIIAPGQFYKLELINAQSVNSTTPGGTLPPEYKLQGSVKYNSSGDIIEEQKTGDVRQVYFWGYNSQYPVAKIIGGDYNTAKQYITQSILDNPASDQALRDELNKLRINLPGTMVTTYTYSPLKGVTSETDPSGKTTYYEYDSFGRLKLIRDRDNNVIKKFDYQYQKPYNQ